MSKLLRRDDRPTAVVAYHDVVALGCIEAIKAEGLAVPEDVSVFGDGDIWCDHMLNVPLTSVRYPLGRMMEEATEKLLAMLAGQYVAPEPSIFGADLVVRASCAPPGGAGHSLGAVDNQARLAEPSAMRVHPSSDLRFAIDGDHETARHNSLGGESGGLWHRRYSSSFAV
jgi:ABC-type sugar transport system substrate-binding protein